jgi:hypothetical protein
VAASTKWQVIPPWQGLEAPERPWYSETRASRETLGEKMRIRCLNLGRVSDRALKIMTFSRAVYRTTSSVVLAP